MLCAYGLVYDSSYFITFLAECLESKDCPYGGFNYQCNANVCECPSPFILVGQLCKGMLTFYKENSHTFPMPINNAPDECLWWSEGSKIIFD